jgi:hypothetical protein
LVWFIQYAVHHSHEHGDCLSLSDGILWVEFIIPSFDHALGTGISDIVGESGVCEIHIGKCTGECSLVAGTRHRLGKL